MTAYLVDGVRPVLGLQTESAVLPVPTPAFPDHGAIQDVSRVELDSWLAGRNLQNATAGWVTCSGGEKHTFLTESRHARCVWVRTCPAANLAAGLSVLASPGEDRQKLWSNPRPGTSFSRVPSRTCCLRSKGVPSTARTSPEDGFSHSARFCVFVDKILKC